MTSDQQFPPTGFTVSQTRTSVSLRRMFVRAACAATLATLGGAALQATAGAAPAVSEAPLLSSSLSGLRQGSQGPAVADLQRALMDAGVFVAGGADGVFGPATKRAVTQFQSWNGLTVTGLVDAATASALVGSSGGGDSGASDGGGSNQQTSTLSEGDRGDRVRELQQRLIDSGVYVAGGADGIFGPATKRAVSQYQGWNGLGVTGTVDASTSASLGLGGAALSPAAPAATPDTAAAPTPPPTSSNAFVGLSTGARGDLVREVQEALLATGLVVRGGADGIFGPATRSSLIAFQGFNRLDQTGVVSERTAELLGLGAGTPVQAAAPPAAAAPARYVGLSTGDRGDLVREAQQALMDAGVPVNGGAAGVFGNATQPAVALYQELADLSVTGFITQSTANALGLGSDQTPRSIELPDYLSSSGGGSSSSGYAGVKLGDRGDRGAALQRGLQDTGLVIRGGADGVFGASTESALKAFQSFNGIPQTGVLTEAGARLLALGSQGAPAPSNPAFVIERFPVQGACFFGDTWHAPRGGGRLHVGTDVIAAEGKLLYAVADGEISKLYWDAPGALAGNGLRILTPNGTYFTYLHMQAFAPGITLGTQVQAGAVIGYIGNTGSSATPHLHFEIHPWGGAAINPYPYLKPIDDCKNSTPQYQSSFS